MFLIVGLGNMKSVKVIESTQEIKNPMLFMNKDLMFSLWQEDNKVLCSSSKNNWYQPITLNNKYDGDVLVYNYLTSREKKNGEKLTRVFGTVFPNIKLFLPKTLLDSENKSIDKEKEVTAENTSENIAQALQENIFKLKEINKNLSGRNDELKMQLQQKQRFINDTEENLRILLEKNKKVEENCNFFMDLQKTTQIDLEKIKKQLEQEKDLTKELKYKLEENNKEREKLLQTIEQGKKQLKDSGDTIKKLKVKLKELSEEEREHENYLEEVDIEKQQMKEEIEKLNDEKEQLNDEKEQLKVELENEKNMPFMYRVLNKKK